MDQVFVVLDKPTMANGAPIECGRCIELATRLDPLTNLVPGHAMQNRCHELYCAAEHGVRTDRSKRNDGVA